MVKTELIQNVIMQIVVPHTVAKLTNAYNLFHLGYLSLQGVVIFVTAKCINYSFSELQSQQCLSKWLRDILSLGNLCLCTQHELNIVHV